MTYAGWLPYDGIYDIGDGWLMEPDKTKPVDDLEDDAPDVANDEVTVETHTSITTETVPSENDDDQPKEDAK